MDDSAEAPPAPSLPPGELCDLIAILLDTALTPRQFWSFAAASPDLSVMLDRCSAAKLDGTMRRQARRDDGLEELEAASRLGVSLIAHGSPAYPVRLSALVDPPPLLWVRGSVPPEEERVVAVVGARRATPHGRRVARRLGRELAEAGIVVVSGLARGIDHEAHAGALDGGGTTWAVLGSGLLNLYPAEHRATSERIVAAGGALLSEFPLRTPPFQSHFPRRNRLIAGLAAGVVVVEARHKSGSLITAEFAMEQGKQVGAVPGLAGTSESEGTHALLRDGAALVESAVDILDAIEAPWADAARDCVKAGRRVSTSPEPASEPERKILAAIGSAMLGLEDLVSMTSLSAAEVRAALVGLELTGRIEERDGGLFSVTEGGARR